MSFRLFADFDGTICSEDTGVYVINKGISVELRLSLEQEILEGKKTYRDAITEMWSKVKLPLNKVNEEIKSQFDLDIGIAKLREFLKKRKLPLYILSNGLDVLIEPLLTLHTKINVRNNSCINDIYLLANHGLPKPTGWEVTWRHNSDCGHDKAETIQYFLRKGETAVFVGDGISDIDAVKSLQNKHFPTLIFAKEGKQLEKYCKENDINYFPFKTLVDVVNKLENYDFSNKRKVAASSSPVKKAKMDNMEVVDIKPMEPVKPAKPAKPVKPSKATKVQKPIEQENELKIGSHALVYVERDECYMKCIIDDYKNDKYVCKDMDEEDPFDTLILPRKDIKLLLNDVDSNTLSIGQDVLAIWPETTAAYPVKIVKVLKSKVSVQSTDEGDDKPVNVLVTDICVE